MTNIKEETTEELVEKDLKPENPFKRSPGNPNFYKGMEPWNKNKKYTKKPKEPTLKEQKYIQEKIDGKCGADAVINAGYDVKDRNSASTIAWQKNNKPLIRDEIRKGLLGLKITPKYLLKRLNLLIEHSPNDVAALNTVKYLFELMGWSKDNAEQEVQKMVFNINQAVIPLTVTKTSAVQLITEPSYSSPTEEKAPIEGDYEEVEVKERTEQHRSTEKDTDDIKKERVDPVAHLRKKEEEQSLNPDADPVGGHKDLD